MTFRMALKHIRRNAPEVEGTFRTICRNRYCHGVRHWSIYDIAKHENLLGKRRTPVLQALEAHPRGFWCQPGRLIMEGRCGASRAEPVVEAA